MSKSSKEEVESFLSEFLTKLNTFDVLFLNRDKNREALLILEISSLKRYEYLKSLKLENYFNGPNDDVYDPESPPNWEFGMDIKEREVYIKINLGKSNKKVVCISFHIAEKKIIYPFK
jgi:hypothetical protein